MRGIGGKVRLFVKRNLRKVNEAPDAEGENKAHPTGNEEARQKQNARRFMAELGEGQGYSTVIGSKTIGTLS